jgi:hypothetical protein
MLSHTESRLEVKYAGRDEEFSSVSIQRVSVLLCPFRGYEFIPRNGRSYGMGVITHIIEV